MMGASAERGTQFGQGGNGLYILFNGAADAAHRLEPGIGGGLQATLLAGAVACLIGHLQHGKEVRLGAARPAEEGAVRTRVAVQHGAPTCLVVESNDCNCVHGQSTTRTENKTYPKLEGEFCP